ncbi:MAG: hypothetical protein F6K47_30415 [Symploca sp. SIO2E6]|nr:hypothetical protein [Symploca sp. SIO2E6]
MDRRSITIEEQPKEFDTDDIAAHKLSKIQDFETDEEEPIWRGVFTISHSTKVLFSKEIDLKVDKLPTWKPHIVIDRPFWKKEKTYLRL